MTRQLLRLCLLAAAVLGPALALPPGDDFETVRTSNAAILNRLGLVPLALTDGHHRKRLAAVPDSFLARNYKSPGHGRLHGSPHDSHVYVVKLPASPPYYSFSKPQEERNATIAKPDPGFRSNGKPAKIFHWNLPLVKKINEKRKQMALVRLEQARRKLEAERERQKVADKLNYLKKLAQEQLVREEAQQQQQRKPSRNNDKWLAIPEQAEPRSKSTDNATQLKILSSSSDKAYRLAADESSPNQHHFSNWHESAANDLHGSASRNSLDGARAKKHKKKSAISYYYAPALTGKSASTSISKHFAGNGKPKAFYVMEKSRKPVYYHPLLP